MASSSALLAHLTVLQPTLFQFFTIADAIRFSAMCREVRQDTETVGQLVSQFPVAQFVLQCSSISSMGCTPHNSPLQLHPESCASALSVAARWASEIVPLCYQWQIQRGVSIKMEPFVLPLAAACTDASAEAIKKVLQIHGIAASAHHLEASWKLRQLRCSEEDSDDTTDSDSDSDWEDDDSESDSDWSDEEGEAMGSMLDLLPAKYRRVVQQLVNDSNSLSLCRLRVDCQSSNDPRRPPEARELLLGLHGRGAVLAGVLVRSKAGW